MKLVRRSRAPPYPKVGDVLLGSLDAGQEPEGVLIHAAGRSYHVIDIGAGPTTVFLHGGGPGSSSWTDFGSVAPLFATSRRCLLVDLLQYGRSDKLPIVGPRWDFLAHSLEELLEEMGADRVDLVCNSWGGSVALALAALRPERVRSAVITGSMPVQRGPYGPLPDHGRRGRQVRDAYYGLGGPTREKMRSLLAENEWYDPSLIPEETVERRYQQSLDPEEMLLAASSDELRGEAQDLAHHLAAVRARILLLWGKYDAFLSPEYALMLSGMMERAELFVMDRTSHHPQEERPVDYFRIVSAWLDSEDCS